MEPKKVIRNAMALGKIVRVFEWLDTPPNIGHPNTLKAKLLNKWLKGEGKVENLKEAGCVGKAYYGIFRGNRYKP